MKELEKAQIMLKSERRQVLKERRKAINHSLRPAELDDTSSSEDEAPAPPPVVRKRATIVVKGKKKTVLVCVYFEVMLNCAHACRPQLSRRKENWLRTSC